MKKNSTLLSFLCLFFVLGSYLAKGQSSTNTVRFKVTYNPAIETYTAYLVPDYNVPNANNPTASEEGSTAQFTLVVPRNFVISNITDINGSWEKNPQKLGPGQPNQDWSAYNLDPTLNYYPIGKASSETDYGSFAVGQPVALFTFKGNGCFGPIQPLAPNDPFNDAASIEYWLNVSNSFNSRSGQPSGGNQGPLEQFADITGTPTTCLLTTADAATVVAGATVIVPVLVGDRNADGTPVVDLTKVTLPVLSAPTKGIATVNADGTVTYTANPGTSGVDSFFYTICDKTDSGVCSSGTISITITPIPIANPDVAAVVAGATVSIAVLANDKNPDGTTIVDVTKVTLPVVAATGAGAPAKGRVFVNPDGTISYTANQGTTGADVFTYTICDKANPSVCTSSTVTVTITPSPVANPDAATVVAGFGVTIPILANDKNADGTLVIDLTKVTLPVVTVPSKGNVMVNPDGTVSYTANPGTSGVDVFTYSICDKANPSVCSSSTITVSIIPSPVANPDAATVVAGFTVAIPILTNDKNPDGTSVLDLTKVTLPVLVASGAGAPTKGRAVVNPDGTVSYTANPGTSGTDTFLYTICDKVNPSVCGSTTVTVTITPSPVANPDAATVVAGFTVSIPILTNDKNPDGTLVLDLTKVTLPVLVASGAGAPTKGRAVVNPDGTVSYTANPGTSGVDVLTYSICDKANPSACSSTTVTVTITPSPVANPDAATVVAGFTVSIPILTNDKNPDGTPVVDLTKVTLPVLVASGAGAPTKGRAVVNPDGTVSYTANPGTSGVDVFTYSICDKSNASVCASSTVTVTITSSPVANPDAATVVAGFTVSIPILTNDKNPDGTPVVDLTKVTLPVLVASGTGAPTKGRAVVNPDGTVSYTANPGTSGVDTFLYTICDKANASVCASSTVTVTITPSPVANPDAATVVAGFTVSIPILTNDKNPDGTPVVDLTKVTLPVLVASGAGAPAKGRAVVNPDGTVSYTANPGTSGVDAFTYSICDKSNASVCASSTVTVTITSSPIANPDAATVVAGFTVSIPILTNDKNPDGTPVVDLTKVTLPVLVASGTGAPAKGRAVVNPDGTVSYTANPGTSGVDTFLYTICDKANPSVCSSTTVTVTITPSPVANPDAATVVAGVGVTIPILANDKNPDGTPIVDLTKVTLPVLTGSTKGTAVVNPDGTVSYTANQSSSGTDVLVYTICDKANPGICSSSTLTVTISPDLTVVLLPKAYLQGALIGVPANNLLMRDDLRTKGYLPTTSPYPAIGMSGRTSVPPTTTAVLSTTGTNAIVDWVFVELRSGSDVTQIVDSRSALIQRNGSIVDVDGVSPLTFQVAKRGSYYVSVRHRNHLGVLSAQPLPLSYTTTVVDFRNATTPTYNLDATKAVNQAQVVVDQGRALWAGNPLYDKEIIYQGPNNDVSIISQQVINASGNIFVTAFFKLKGYYPTDINLNGEAIFQGPNNDVEFIYQNIIKNHPGNAFKLNFFKIKEQLP